jgi:hypothetical protein
LESDAIMFFLLRVTANWRLTKNEMAATSRPIAGLVAAMTESERRVESEELQRHVWVLYLLCGRTIASKKNQAHLINILIYLSESLPDTVQYNQIEDPGGGGGSKPISKS